MPEFTTNWFSHNKIPHWQRVLQKFRDRPAAALEIGSYEGRSAIFLLEYLSQCHLTCVDPFLGDYEERFDRNLAPFADRLEKIKDRSIPALDRLHTDGRRFDVIYIDGNHERHDVICDSVLAWPMLKIGGVLVWDDWRWKRKSLPSEKRPQHAIDLFCSAFAPCFKFLHRETQVIIEKTAEWPLPSPAAAVTAEVTYRLRKWWAKAGRTIHALRTTTRA